MFFRCYNRPGLTLSLPEQQELRKELLSVARTCFNPVPDYQCLSSRPDALDDKIIIVAYAEADSMNFEEETKNRRKDNTSHGEHCAVAFTSTLFLDDVPGVRNPVLHTGLTVAIPSVHRTGILAELFAQLFLNVVPMHPEGMWVTTLAAVLSSLVQSERALARSYPSPSAKRSMDNDGPPRPSSEYYSIARAIDKRYRAQLLISPKAIWDEESFVFRGSLDWDNQEADGFKKDVDDKRYWHRDEASNVFFRGLMREGKGDEVLLIGFVNEEILWKKLEELQQRQAEKRLLKNKL
ncbi:hypothetical protein R3P38DRAFT_2859204 [Favolaschia claudopus]|uniref:N-acetyltransferase domain-containing protein n=1 Tax=Favolaschia claudopus TaxID=2862362 RepID=A0AAW0DKM2_9AGAR